MHPRKFIRDSVGYAFSQYVVRATLMLRGLIAARLLGPTTYGTWNAIQILMDYGNLATMGSQQGLDQLVPPRIVADDPVALRRVKRAALFNISLLTGIFMLACLAAGQFGSSRMLHMWGPLGIGAAVLCALTTNLAYYQTSIMRSHGDISTASGWMAVQGGVGGILGLALVRPMGAWGLLLGWLVGCVAAYVFSSVRSREFAPRLPKPANESFDLIQVGFPMYLYNASTQVMRNLDRLIILHFLGTDSLGYYSLSVMALTFLLYLPDSVTYVLYPQLLRDFGMSGRNAASIRPRVERVLRLSSVMVPALCGAAYLISKPVVQILLPKFLPGVDALRVLCFGAVALAFTGLSSVVLMTLGRQLMLMPAALFSVALYAGLDLVAVRTGHGITGVAWGTLTAYLLNSVMMLLMAQAGLEIGARQSLATLLRVYTPFALSLGLAVGLTRFLPRPAHPGAVGSLVRLGVSLAIYSLVYSLGVRPLTRGLGIRRALSEFDVPIVGALVRRIGRGRPRGDA
ncbi:MAG TPA: oligosaccharide flippase family protein [Candidatus Acidoferrales bacterium]|nr:oligosaccharide flippase family protein [Candidatus Acidoferrales bacterium]